MAWGRTGTVSFTNGSTVVTGVGTQFLVEMRQGDGIRGPDGLLYEAANLVSNTQLTLGQPYAGPTIANRPLWVVATQGYLQKTGDELRDWTNKAGELVDSPSIEAFATVSGAANAIPMFTAVDAMVAFLTGAAGRAILAHSTPVEVKAYLALGNVNNTSDAQKPVSTAQQQALDGKQPLHANLTGLSALPNVADRLLLFAGVGGISQLQLGAVGKAVAQSADQPTARANLGLGTAAVTNITASFTDTTAGRAMKTGDGGLLGTPVAVSLENYFATRPTSIGWSPNSPGRPPLAYSGYGYAIHLSANSDGTSDTVDLFVPYNRPQQLWTSARNSGTQTGWYNIASIGLDQTWTVVGGGGARALGTTYVNGTSRPIQLLVIATGASAANTALDCTVAAPSGGVVIAGRSAYATAAGQVLVLHGVIVPPGHSYTVSAINGTASLNYWSELTA